MARIVVGGYVVRFPLGGYLSWSLQWLLGLHRLGHDVHLVEKAGWDDACFDPATGEMGDDCSFGTRAVDELMRRHGLEGRWCFVDRAGRSHGLPYESARALVRGADLFLDMGAHGEWAEETDGGPLSVLLDGEAGYTQMKLAEPDPWAPPVPDFDRYCTVGLNIGTPRSSAPTAGKNWRPFLDPVVPELFDPAPPGAGAAYTTVMSWQAHEPIEYEGRSYGQKDVEFERVLELPRRVLPPLEVAVAGGAVPRERLAASGWRVQDAHAVTASFDAWRDYISSSRGELSVCKNVFVETWSGWFSDRSACYLAAGRPVVLQDTGWSEHLPTGEGLFAFRDADGAAAAIEEIERDWPRHSRAARRIAEEHLSTDVVLPRLLGELGVA